MPLLDQPSGAVDVYSIAELVRVRMDTSVDPWRLSLVQRGQVWKDTQVAYLLDSLLFGYPIGSFLLCTVRHGGNVLERDGELRVRREAPEGTWQLLDGQQRLNSLAWLFAGPTDPEKRRFHGRLDVARDIDDVTLRKRTLEEALRYVRSMGEGQEIEDRWRWLDVSGLYRASLGGDFPSASDMAVLAEDQLIALAERIDAGCRAEAWKGAPDEQRHIAADRVRRLLLAWLTPSVPVVRLRLEGPLDVLQVFARVNRTGTAVAGDDLFFAGVKTIWVDAEEHIDRVQRASPLLRRMAALRLLARIASNEATGNDLLPLDIERLHGDAGHRLVGAMERLASSGSRVIDRIHDLSRIAMEESGLGYALHVIHPTLYDHALVWAIAREVWPPGSDHLVDLWGYLVGASAFRYRQIFAEPFDRLAFQLALQAGRRNEPFPTKQVATACRREWPGLRKRRQTVACVTTDAERRQFVNDSWDLVLHIAQQVPFTLPVGRKFDWEHLYPVARINDMRWKGPDGTWWLQRYDGANDLWRAGNLFVLDEVLNRSAQDDWPHLKLPAYRAKGLWPMELFLTGAEEEDLLAASRLFEQGDVIRGMPLFRRYVTSRELRLFDEVMRRYPSAAEFAGLPPA